MTNHIKPATSDEIQKIAREVKKMAAEVTKDHNSYSRSSYPQVTIFQP